ncbi:MAG: phosphate regulon sensor histidine kinase PhoR [Cellvibrionales bacterium]|nr:phosphate regulon sensor histidine kinase PhoR [Cellvibrionales bacterium]
MNKSFSIELRRFLLILVITALVGFWLNNVLICSLIGLSIYVIWTFYNIYILARWFPRLESTPPPESIGFWGALCDELYRYQHNNESEKNKLRADVAYLRDSFASLHDAVVMVDRLGGIEWCNDAARPILGLSLDKDYGQTLTHLLREPQFIQFFDSGNYADSIKVHSLHKPNSVLRVQITRFGQGNRLVFARDITEIARLEGMRRDFVSNVSHELRTPLTVITGYIDNFHLLTEQMPALQNPLNQMAQQAERMEQLIKDLLDLSKLETKPNEVHRTPVSISDLSQVVLEEARARCRADNMHRSLALDVEQPISILGQESELHSALSNLVINACKYTEENGSIHICVGLDDQGGYFSVLDNGVGIDPTHIPRLTERFYRIDKSRSFDTGGTGLGLAIVKRILLRHDSSLEITSQLGKGSEFICRFPKHRLISH